MNYTFFFKVKNGNRNLCFEMYNFQKQSVMGSILGKDGIEMVPTIPKTYYGFACRVS